MTDGQLKDKALIYWEDMWLSVSWDFMVVSWYEVILQAAQNRVLAYLETRMYDSRFGSEIAKALHNTPSSKITDQMMSTYVNYALQPMVSDSRIQSVDSVKIIWRDKESITVEIILIMWTFRGSVVVAISNFSS